VISGLAIDSIRGGPLTGAIVRVAETDIQSTSDSLGRFVLTGVPRGTYRLELFHPLLDTLRVAIKSAARQSTGSDSVVIAFGTPSVATLVALKCSADERKLGPAMAVGIVSEAGTEIPADRAVVSVEWTDYDVRGKSLTTTPRKRSGIVGPDGTYKICGIPGDLETGMFATRGNDTTVAVPADFRPGLSITSFRLAPLAAATTTGRVSGRVVDSAGRSVEGARISAEKETAVVMSGADGFFELTGLKPGTRGIMVRRLGFLPVARPVEIVGETATKVEIRMSKFVPVLETVRISARRNLSLERVGFTARARSGFGRWISPDDIERRRPMRLNDLLSMVPSLRTSVNNRGDRVISSRRNECVGYFVDGFRWTDIGESPDTFISGHELGAVEIYEGLSAPGEFRVLGREGQTCTSIVIWTKWKLRI
jgi:hypothetical protein